MNSDQAIDTIRAALQHADPPSGLEQRLLQTLAAHSSAPAPAEPHPSAHRHVSLSVVPAIHEPSPRRPPLAVLTLAATVLIAVSLASLHQHHSPTTATRPTTNSTRTTTSTPIHESEFHRHPERSEDPPHFALSDGVQRRTPTIPVKSSAMRQTPHTVSYPAPPLPLTRQEKLLLQVAHAQDPQHSTVLNPNLRASLAARDTEDFTIFFAPATTIRHQQPPN